MNPDILGLRFRGVVPVYVLFVAFNCVLDLAVSRYPMEMFRVGVRTSKQLSL